MVTTYKLFAIAYLLLLANFHSSGQTPFKKYKLLDSSSFSDIDYKAILALDTLGPGKHLLEKVFKPTKGNFTVYRFLATFIGKSRPFFSDETKEFHDVVILKTDSNRKIIDAFQYTLEWAEPPNALDLFKCSCRSNNIYLRDGLSVKEFKFLGRNWYEGIPKFFAFKEDGVLVFK